VRGCEPITEHRSTKRRRCCRTPFSSRRERGQPSSPRDAVDAVETRVVQKRFGLFDREHRFLAEQGDTIGVCRGFVDVVKRADN
jgi:hypothetical protein